MYKFFEGIKHAAMYSAKHKAVGEILRRRKCRRHTDSGKLFFICDRLREAWAMVLRLQCPLPANKYYWETLQWRRG